MQRVIFTTIQYYPEALKMLEMILKSFYIFNSGFDFKVYCLDNSKDKFKEYFDKFEFKNLEFKIRGFRPIEEAIITAGGVSTKEINSSTMESKIIKGLYFAGEIIDVDAYTGGFNLQIAYSTGYVAGMN